MIKTVISLFLFSTLLGCASSQSVNFKYDARLTGFEYPFEVREFTFESQNQQLVMAYMDLIPKGKSIGTVVLLHGKNFAGFYWEKIAQGLIDKGYRVIIPDQIGFGKSTKPRNYQYSFSYLAHNTKRLLESLKIKKFQIVGHSMGGMLATHMSSFYERSVERLVLINPIGLEDYLKYVKIKDIDFFYKNELAKTTDKARAYQRKNYYRGDWNESYEALLQPFKGWKNGADYELVAWNNAKTYGPIFSEPIVDKFSELSLPIIMILGTEDRTGPGRFWKKQGVTRKLGQYQNLGSQIKNRSSKVKLIELAGLGHMPQFEDYQSFSNKFYPLF